MNSVARIENWMLQNFSLRQILSAIGGITSGIIVLSVFLLFMSFATDKLSQQIEMRAHQTAARVAKYAYSYGELWSFHSTRLADIIELPGDDKNNYKQTVYATNRLLPVVEEVTKIQWPTMHVDHVITVNGKNVGYVRVEATANSLLVTGAWIILFSLLLSFLANSSLKMFPLKALDRTLAELAVERHSLRETGDRFELALESMSQGLALFDPSGKILVANERLKKFLDGTEFAERVDLDFVAVCRAFGIDKEFRSTAGLHQTAIPAGGLTKKFEHTLPSGLVFVSTAKTLSGGGVLVVVDDVSLERKAQAEVEYFARYDCLTGLVNRSRFTDELEAALKGASHAKKTAVYCLDLDRFKAVNDTLGHAAGDNLLKQVATRIEQNVRGTDLVARLGGDEFAIVQSGIEVSEDFSLVAQRLVNAIQEPFDIEGQRVQIGVSIGIAFAPNDGTEAAEILKLADIALYQAKADGRNAFRFFEVGMDERMRLRREVENDLRQAIGSSEFELHYQPLFDLKANTIVGCEALLRWRHATRGLVSPADFIPLAEETGLIKQIGSWALKQACKDAALWPSHMFVAVNLSAIQFSGTDLIEDVKAALEISGLDANRLELEITESIILHETTSVLRILEDLKKIGTKISMDDFGTGYSSLAYLQKFPFDKIKIDRAFVDGMDAKADSRAIVRAIISMSMSLGMTTTGEGVETENELECLRDAGCTQAQGYLISRPVPAAALEALFLSHSQIRVAA